MFRLATAIAAGALLAVTSVTGTAAAKPIERGTFHDEFSFVDPDLCDIAGLDIDVEGVIDGAFRIRSQGRAGLPYYMDRAKGTQTFTNPDNGRFVTDFFNVLQKDLRVTDNRDGTSTVLVLATGNNVTSGMDGEVIARNPGQTRFELLIDNGGTPQDPSDDEFLEFLGVVKESTGRTDDFCAAVVPALS